MSGVVKKEPDEEIRCHCVKCPELEKINKIKWLLMSFTGQNSSTIINLKKILNPENTELLETGEYVEEDNDIVKTEPVTVKTEPRVRFPVIIEYPEDNDDVDEDLLPTQMLSLVKYSECNRLHHIKFQGQSTISNDPDSSRESTSNLEKMPREGSSQRSPWTMPRGGSGQRSFWTMPIRGSVQRSPRTMPRGGSGQRSHLLIPRKGRTKMGAEDQQA